MMKAGLTCLLLARLISFFRVYPPKKVGCFRKIRSSLAFSAVLLLGFSSNTGANIVNTEPLLPVYPCGTNTGDATVTASSGADSSVPVLEFGLEICNNGIDDDGDGLIDAADPDCCSSLISLSKTGWSLHYKDSEETVGENGAATNAFDGDVNTIWHSKWYYANDPLPHEIQIDLGSNKNIGGFRYWPRQAGVNGRIGNYQLYLSSDGSSWGSPIVSGTWIYSDYSPKEVQFAVTTARYIRLRATSEAYGNVWTSAAEIDVLTCAVAEICNNGIDDDGDGLIDCADSDCNETSYATVVTSQSGVANPNNALGAPDNAAAKLYDTNDQMVLDFGTAQPAGTTFTIRWRKTSSSNPQVSVAQSSNGSTFSAVAGSPFNISTSSFFDQNITVSASTRYLRFINTNSRNTDLDAVTVVACLSEVCGNGTDDDGDGLIDCADPECSLGLAVNAGAGVSICTGGSTTLTASATGGTTPYTYAWSNGLGSGASKSVSPAGTTTYTVTVTSANGCTATSQVTVTVVAGPAISVQPVGFTECTGGTQALTVSGTGGTPSLTYQWQSSTNNSSFNNIPGATAASYTPPATVAGTNYYRVSLTASGSGCGSATSGSATVVVVAGPAISAQPASATICTGGAQTLSVTATGGMPSLVYQWQSSTDNVTFSNIGGATSSSYTTPALASTKYYRVVVSAGGIGCGSVTSNTATVTVAAPPSVATSSNVSICQSASTTISASATGSSPFTYAWSNGLGSGASKIVTPASTTTYTVTVTGSNGCTATGQVTVTVSAPPSVTTSSNVAICSGTSTDISASATGAGPFSYLWNNGLGAGDTKTVTPASTTAYTVTVTDASGCTATKQVTVTVNQTPAANAGPDVTICKFFSTTLTASASGGASPYTYAWSDGLGSGTTKTVTPLTTKTYTVTVTSANGCLSTDQVTVTVQNCSEICGNGLDDDGGGLTDCADSDCGSTATVSSAVTICNGQSTTLSVSATGGNGPLTYLWSHGLGAGLSKTVTPSATMTYSVTVTATGSGCTDVAAVTVTVSVCAENCTNGIDDDGDGLIDCADPDCSGITVPVLVDDEYTTCPGMPFSDRVTYNDNNLLSPIFSIYAQPSNGMVAIDATGKFYYTPLSVECTSDVFTYQVCNTATGCCALATATVHFGDTTPPVLTNVPADITISCDDILPAPGLVTAFDQCPGIYVEFDETSGQFEAGACESYNIVRTWTATDLCGNTAVGQQTISVADLTDPELFRVYTLENGSKLIAGVSKRVTGKWKYVRFPVAFSQPPLVFTQLISSNDGHAAIVWQRNISKEGFEIRLKEEEAADGIHDFENVAWVALMPSAQSGPFAFEAGTLNDVNQLPQTLNFSPAFSGVPHFFSAVQTANEFDPATLRHPALTSSVAEFSLQEETSGDAETAHANEKAGYLAIETGKRLTDDIGQVLGEAGKINLTNACATVTLSGSYTKPVVLIGGLTVNDLDPVTVRVHNVTSNSFDVHLQEWDFLDGNHAAETVSYLVVEGSIPSSQDFYCGMMADSLKPGENVFLMDNCDNNLNLSFQKSSVMTPFGLRNNHTWQATDDCGNSLSINRSDTCTIAAVRLKTLLNGALQSSNGQNTMRDDLRANFYVPAVAPYKILPGFAGDQINYEEDEFENIETTVNTESTAGDTTSGSSIPENFDNITFGYRTVSNGNWTNPATWEGGNVPPVNCISGQIIRIDHTVILTSGDLKLDNSAALYVVGGRLTLLTGHFEINTGSATFVNAGLYSILGDILLNQSNSRLAMKNCTVYTSGDFKNNSGKRTLEGVCLTIDKTYENKGGLDTLINVCATIFTDFQVSNNGNTTVRNSAFKVIFGDFENKSGCTLNGSHLTIWVTNGNLKNNGTWTASVSNYCVSDAVTVSVFYLPYLESCGTIAVEFNGCDCSVPSGNSGGGGAVFSLTPDYETIADGAWASAATWKNGAVPPAGDIIFKVVKIKHAASLANNNLKLKSNTIFIVDGGSLTMSNGDFLIQDAKAYFRDATFASPNGELSMDSDSAYLEMVNCVVNVDEQFKNSKGKRKLENVCLTLNDDFINDDGVDTLVNVCAVVEKDFKNDSHGTMHLVNTKVKVNTGQFENRNGSTFTGKEIVIWVLDNDLKNGGIWKGLVETYCVSGSIIISQTFRPLTEECTGIQTYFEPCSCDGSSSTTTSTTTETSQNPFITVGKMDVQLMEVQDSTAVVDWVVVELRDSLNEKNVLKAITALVTRDGEVVSEQGDSILYFPGIYEGNYYVSVRHRNHTALMTDVPFYLSSDNPPELDFTDLALPVRGGSAAGKIANGMRTMWSGDFNEDGKIIYQGPNNDVFYLFSRVLSEENNVNFLANFIVTGYELQDVNLDGKVIFQGPNNDRAFLLFNSILSHPGNLGKLANFVVQENLP